MTTCIRRMGMPKMLMAFCLALCMGLSFGAKAQPSAFLAERQALAVLPHGAEDLWMMDSMVYCSLDGALLCSRLRGCNLLGFVPDTVFVKVDDGIRYAVRRPGVDEMYFTRTDRRGRSTLHYSYRDGKRVKTKRVQMDGVEVEHPTFSADGTIMVFSSLEKTHSYGGYDLWYSVFRNGQWQAPVNMGARVNTGSDERVPVVVGEYLYFSSNGRDDSRRRTNLYVTRLIADDVVGDTVGMIQIGRSRVQHLPQPFNLVGKESNELAFDTVSNVFYYCMDGKIWAVGMPLMADMLWGFVGDGEGNPLVGAEVRVFDGVRLVSETLVDEGGFYRVCLPVRTDPYRVQFYAENHFASEVDIYSRKNDAGNLMGESRRDMTLDGLPVGRPIVYADLFGPNASVELNERGREVLLEVARFLNDNNQLRASLSLTSDLTSDAPFNAMLTARRLESVEQFLLTLHIDASRIEYRNACAGRDGCGNATGESQLSLLLKP